MLNHESQDNRSKEQKYVENLNQLILKGRSISNSQIEKDIETFSLDIPLLVKELAEREMLAPLKLEEDEYMKYLLS